MLARRRLVPGRRAPATSRSPTRRRWASASSTRGLDVRLGPGAPHLGARLLRDARRARPQGGARPARSCARCASTSREPRPPRRRSSTGSWRASPTAPASSRSPGCTRARAMKLPVRRIADALAAANAGRGTARPGAALHRRRARARRRERDRRPARLRLPRRRDAQVAARAARHRPRLGQAATPGRHATPTIPSFSGSGSTAARPHDARRLPLLRAPLGARAGVPLPPADRKGPRSQARIHALATRRQGSPDHDAGHPRDHAVLTRALGGPRLLRGGRALTGGRRRPPARHEGRGDADALQPVLRPGRPGPLQHDGRGRPRDGAPSRAS